MQATAGPDVGADDGRPSNTRAWWMLGLLSLLYVLSFIDRVILALLIAPLKSELGVSDVQLGLLFGPAFGVFYALLGLPIARVADRGNRRRLVVAGVALWGAATVGSAFVNSFWLLVVLRIGLAVGEAALTPATFSLIGDLFPARRRSLAASIYVAIGIAGTSSAYIIGAAVVQASQHLAGNGAEFTLAPWRLVLAAVGAPSLLIGLLFALTTREPPRVTGPAANPSIGEFWRDLRKRARLIISLFTAAGLIQAVGYAYAAWGPELVRRSYGVTIAQAGYAFGLAGLAAGFLGTFTVPFLTRNLERRGRSDAVPLASLSVLAPGIILAVIAPLQTSETAFLVLYTLASFCLNGAANNIGISIQTFAAPQMRGTFAALSLTFLTLLGLGIGPLAAAALSAAFDPSGRQLGRALSALAPCVTVLAGLLLLWGRGAGMTARPQDQPA